MLNGCRDNLVRMELVQGIAKYLIAIEDDKLMPGARVEAFIGALLMNLLQ